MSILIVLRGNEEENANEEKEACKFVRDGINKTFYFGIRLCCHTIQKKYHGDVVTTVLIYIVTN